MDSGLAAVRRPGMTLEIIHHPRTRQRCGNQPAGPGPAKINEALVPPKPKEFDST
jgi:hypothetical protein